MRVGELARATGVSTDTIRFYEARGLVTDRVSFRGAMDAFATNRLQRIEAAIADAADAEPRLHAAI